MKAIIIAFTLKGQDIIKIQQAVSSIREQVGANTILIHGFMPLSVVLRIGYDQSVVRILEVNFPVQLNMFDKMPLREEMAQMGKTLNAHVYVIGEVKEGVQQEVELYKKAGLTITYVPI